MTYLLFFAIGVVVGVGLTRLAAAAEHSVDRMVDEALGEEGGKR